MAARRERGFASIGLVVAVAVVVALFAVPLVLMTRMGSDSTERAAETVEGARDAAARLDLSTAVQTAEMYRAESGNYEGFTAEVAAGLDSRNTYTESAAVPGVVSVRAVTASEVLFVTRTPTGDPVCAVAGEGGPRYGTADALTPDDCA
jgi:Tfp pilus assembly protein FimT